MTGPYLTTKTLETNMQLELRNRFETLQEKTEKVTPNDEYENFVEAHLEAASKWIPTKPRTKYRVSWETSEVREKRALVKTVSKSYRKNPTNTNARKLEKAQYQLAGIYLKEQAEYIQHFKNLLGNPPKITDEPITRIISKQLDVKLGPFTKEELDSVLRRIKNRKAAGLDEIPPEVWKTR